MQHKPWAPPAQHLSPAPVPWMEPSPLAALCCAAAGGCPGRPDLLLGDRRSLPRSLLIPRRGSRVGVGVESEGALLPLGHTGTLLPRPLPPISNIFFLIFFNSVYFFSSSFFFLRKKQNHVHQNFEKQTRSLFVPLWEAYVSWSTCRVAVSCGGRAAPSAASVCIFPHPTLPLIPREWCA